MIRLNRYIFSLKNQFFKKFKLSLKDTHTHTHTHTHTRARVHVDAYVFYNCGTIEERIILLEKINR